MSVTSDVSHAVMWLYVASALAGFLHHALAAALKSALVRTSVSARLERLPAAACSAGVCRPPGLLGLRGRSGIAQAAVVTA